MSRSSLSRAALAVGLPLIALGLLECGGGAPPATPRALFLQGGLVTPEAVVCVPGRRFQAADAGGWQLVARASVFCRVTRTLDSPLALRLRTADADPDAGQGLDLRWQGQPVTPIRSESSGVLELSVSPAELSPGLYELTVRPLPPGSPKPVVLSGLEYALGDQVKSLRPERREHSLRLLDFLLHGVTGGGEEKWGGWLFDGPGSLDVDLADGDPVRLHLQVENLSSAKATFRAGGVGSAGSAGDRHSVELGPGERGRLSLEVGRGQRAIEVAVSGPDDGLFLWRAPRVEAPSPDPDGSSASPPLVLITLDTTRRDALGVYGAPPEVTPVLDELARHATVFDRAVSTTSWTLPSHASMLTGLYPSHHGAGVRRADLLEPEVTLAELLRRHGYFNAGFAGGTLCSSRFGLSRGFQVYRDPDGGLETRGDRLTDYVLALLDEDGTAPRFLFVNYFDPHAPLRAPEEMKERMGVRVLQEALSGSSGSPVWRRIAAGKEGWGPLIQQEPAVRRSGRELARALYHAEVAFMDRQIGRLLDGLRHRGLYDEALLVVVADHGELLGESGYFGHAGRLDPELVEVPLIVKWPHQTEPHRVSSLVTVTDVFPTLLEAAGIEPPPSDGTPLPRRDVSRSDRSFAFLEEHESLVHPLPPHLRIANHVYGIQGLRTRRVVWPQGQECARRERDGWRAEACRGDVRETLARVQRLLGLPETERSDQGRGMTEEDRRALQALGYL